MGWEHEYEDWRDSFHTGGTREEYERAMREDVEKPLTDGAVAPESILNFMLAGRAQFGIENTRTNNLFKYRVEKTKDKENMFFIKLHTGTQYDYVGYIYIDHLKEAVEPNIKYVSTVDKNGRLVYRLGVRKVTFGLGKTVDISPLDPRIQAISYVLVHHDRLPQSVVVWHMGRCGRCGRALTDPESIMRGLGPECAKKGI